MTSDYSFSQTLRHLVLVLFSIWLGAMLFVALRHVSGVLTERGFDSNPFDVVRYITLYFWLPWFVAAPFVALLARRLPIRPDHWVLPLAANVGLWLTLSLLQGLAAAYFYHYLGNLTPAMATYEPWQHTGHFLFGDDMFLLNTIAYAVLAADLNIGKFHRIVRQKDLDALRLGESLAELRLQTLRMQINPHFLFNSLNAVCVLINKNEPKSAIEMIKQMSSFFRRTLEGIGEQWVTLERELEAVAEYLAIAKFRFGDRLVIRQECDTGARALRVPSMLLQPLVENAVVHGIAEKPGACELVVRCERIGDRLLIRVIDDGVGNGSRGDPRFKEGIGLRNVRQRLEQLYGSDFAFHFDSELGLGTRVTVDVPAQPRSSILQGVAF